MDIPTEPVAGASGNREPDCPAEARRRGLQGRLLLRVNVSASGAAAFADVPIQFRIEDRSGYRPH
jgi:outer membrane biosynthesis protein TonB